MSKQISDAYIVAATRTPIGKSHRGFFRNTRPDDLLVAALQGALKQVPNLDPKAIEDAKTSLRAIPAVGGVKITESPTLDAYGRLPYTVDVEDRLLGISFGDARVPGRATTVRDGLRASQMTFP